MRANAFYVMLTQVAVALTPLVITPFLTRTIGAGGLGLYGFSYAIASAFVVIGQLGVQLYGRREIAKCGDDAKSRTRVFWELVTLLLRSFAIVTPIFLVLALLGDYGDLERSALLLQTFLLLSGAFDIGWLFHGVERFGLLTLSTLITRIAVLASVFLLVDGTNDALVYVAIMAGSFLLSTLIPWFFAGRFVGGVRRQDWTSWRHLKALRYFYVPAISIQFSAIVSVLIISNWGSLTEVGVYDVAYRLSRAPIAFITAFGVVLLPRATRLITYGDKSRNLSLLQRGNAATMFLASAFCFVYIGVADSFIPLFAGPGFEQSATVLRLLSVSLVITGWGNVLRTQVILPAGLDRVYSRSLVGGLLVNIGLSLATVGALGVIGVAASFVLGELFVALHQALSIRRLAPMGRLLSIAIRYIAAGAVATIAMIALHLTGLTGFTLFMLQCLVGMAVYLLGVGAIETLTNEHFITGEFGRIWHTFLGRAY